MTTTMLLRSSSSSMLNSWLLQSKESSPEPEILRQIPRTRSIALSASSCSLSPIEGSASRMWRVLSETDLSSSVHKHWVGAPSRTTSVGPALFPFSELDEGEGGGGSGGGGGGCGGNNGGSGSWDSNHGHDRADEYYRTMIEANPGNPLFLSNYARYLKEVHADYVKAEEYCVRAILADPNDGNVLSMYADLIWESHKDAPRAELYFDQAVKAAPDDCYVLASYAHFLWDAEEEDDVVEEDSSENHLRFLHGTAPPAPPLALAA